MGMIGLFPDDASTRFYTYPGSLTTPPCYESVTWFVADTYQTISTEQLADIHRLHASSNNNRPIQPSNNRMIWRSFEDISASSTGNNAPTPSTDNNGQERQKFSTGYIVFAVIACIVCILFAMAIFKWSTMQRRSIVEESNSI